MTVWIKLAVPPARCIVALREKLIGAMLLLITISIAQPWWWPMASAIPVSWIHVVVAVSLLGFLRVAAYTVAVLFASPGDVCRAAFGRCIVDSLVQAQQAGRSWLL